LESVYRATYRGFKSLILRQNVGNPPARTWLTPSQLGYLSEFGMLVLLRF